MALRNIVELGDPILRKQCRPVGEVTDRTRTILDDMVETMRNACGVGLAAPQVGIMRRMFVAEPEEGRVLYMVDPEILTMEGEQTGEEGCLSVPGKVGTVIRPEKVVMKAKDRDGVEQTYELEGFDAVVVCHEFDHLEGVLYVDKSDDVHYVEE
ncbi:MAG: peptide deformylase [Clostridiales bacterium]|nr:peptide deformylase [Clostridiales bacterium]MDD7036156.1 peptide deformylase [Bacillota bacterium]MDY2921184.1 peptide deformylase [Lentihominibacter sp.]